MVKTKSYKPDKIRESVFNWYSIHKGDCDCLYNKANDPNISSIYEDVSDESELNDLFAKTDLLILTANKYEKNALHQFSYDCTGNRIKKIRLKLNTAIDFYNNITAYSFRIYNYNVLNIHSRVTGAYTNGGAADVVRYVLSNKLLYPVAVISFGICFGTNDKAYNLGDVILSRKIYPYFIGAKVEGEELKVRDDNVLSINDTLALKIDDLRNMNQFNPNCIGFNVGFGNYITGEAVVSSKKFRSRYVGITRQPIIAGDMEAYGVFKECKTPPYDIPCIVLKAICDWGIDKNFDKDDENVLLDYCKLVLKSSELEMCQSKRNDVITIVSSIMDRLQAYAARNSFKVLEILLQNESFAHSAYLKLTKEFANFNGKGASSVTIREITSGELKSFGYSLDNKYIEQCIVLLEKEGYIKNICFGENGKEKLFVVSSPSYS